MLSIIPKSEASRQGNHDRIPRPTPKSSIPSGLRLRAPGEIIQAGDLMRMKGRDWAPIPAVHSVGQPVSLHDHMDFFCAMGKGVARG